jgi:predicted dehydrogenase
MKLGKHAFVQKPLTHSIWEARMLGQIAHDQNVATQMGNQHTADNNLRHSAAMIKAGLLGPVKEVHVWTNRPIWPQGIPRAEAKPAPSQMHWNLYLGPAAYRPFADSYHPFNWRGWWDFGTGSLGDMACHTVNMPFMALDLRNPTSVQAVTTGHNRDSYPSKSQITFEFPATDRHPDLKLFWTDGAVKPMELLANFKPEPENTKSGRKSAKSDGDAKKADSDAQAADDKKAEEKKAARRPRYSDSACIVVGEKGMLYAPGDYAEGKIQLSGGLEEIPVEFPESPGHWNEWVAAIKGGPPAMSNFPNYAVPLTETILLGNLAIWAATEPDVPGKKIDWDAKNLTAKNAPEVAEVIKPVYRAGYSL